jgi:hypothetical protein
MSGTGNLQGYSQQEVTEILKRALKQQSLRSDTMSHDELVEMAQEVGIERGAVEAATAELAQTRADELARQEDAKELAEERGRLLAKFTWSLLTFLVVGTGLYFIDQKVTGGTWYYWPILGWAVALVLQLRQVFFPERSLERRKLNEWKHKEKLERRAAREARRNRFVQAWQTGDPEVVNRSARDFEQAVQAGVAALLSVAARKVQEHTDRAAASRPEKRAARRL